MTNLSKISNWMGKVNISEDTINRDVKTKGGSNNLILFNVNRSTYKCHLWDPCSRRVLGISPSIGLSDLYFVDNPNERISIENIIFLEEDS